MSLAVPLPHPDPLGEDDPAVVFDDTDGAYAVAEPDPFADVGPLTNVRQPSLRAELRTMTTRSATVLSGSRLPPLPVVSDLSEALPDGLRRGSTISVTGSVSLLLALLGESSAHGAWAAMVGMPAISADAAVEAGIDLEHLAIINPPETNWTGASWTTAVGALLDAVDVVVARPGVVGSAKPTDSEARRLTARARSKDAVLILFGPQAAAWPAVELQLTARHDRWSGIGDGYGRLTARRLLVSVTGRGKSGRVRDTELWLPIGSRPGDASPVVPLLPTLGETAPSADHLSIAG